MDEKIRRKSRTKVREMKVDRTRKADGKVESVRNHREKRNERAKKRKHVINVKKK